MRGAAVSQPTPAVRRLGQRLLERELSSAADPLNPDAAVQAAQRVTQGLGQPLSRVIGIEGYWALLRRAVHVAKVEWPLLQELQVSAGPTGGLDAVVGDADAARAREALIAVLSHLMWLLVTFIGEDLTRRTLGEAWPDVQFDDEGSAEGTNG